MPPTCAPAELDHPAPITAVVASAEVESLMRRTHRNARTTR